MGAMNRVNSSTLTSVDDMGRYLESPGLRGVGGSIWNYFFFSLPLGDNINWGGVLNSGNQGSPLMRDIFIQKMAHYGLKQNLSDRNSVLPHKVVLIDPHLFIFLPMWVSPT